MEAVLNCSLLMSHGPRVIPPLPPAGSLARAALHPYTASHKLGSHSPHHGHATPRYSTPHHTMAGGGGGQVRTQVTRWQVEEEVRNLGRGARLTPPRLRPLQYSTDYRESNSLPPVHYHISTNWYHFVLEYFEPRPLRPKKTVSY